MANKKALKNLKERLKNNLQEQGVDPTTFVANPEDCLTYQEEWVGTGSIWAYGLVPLGVEYGPVEIYSGPNVLLQYSDCNTSTHVWIPPNEWTDEGNEASDYVSMWDFVLTKVQAGEMDLYENVQNIVFLSNNSSITPINEFNGVEQPWNEGVVFCNNYADMNPDYCQDGAPLEDQISSWAEAPASGACSYNGQYWRRMQTILGFGAELAYDPDVPISNPPFTVSSGPWIDSQEFYWGVLLGSDYTVLQDLDIDVGGMGLLNDTWENNEETLTGMGYTVESWEAIMGNDPFWYSWGDIKDGVESILTNALLKQCPGGGTNCDITDAEPVEWNDPNWFDSITGLASLEAYLETYFIGFEQPDGQYIGVKAYLSDFSCSISGGCYKNCMCQCQEDWCQHEDGSWVTGGELCEYNFGCADPAASNYDSTAAPGNPFTEFSNSGYFGGPNGPLYTAMAWAYINAYPGMTYPFLSGEEGYSWTLGLDDTLIQELGVMNTNETCVYEVGCADFNAPNFDMSIITNFFNQSNINWDYTIQNVPVPAPPTNIPLYSGGNINVGGGFGTPYVPLFDACIAVGSNLGGNYGVGELGASGYSVQGYIDCYVAAGAIVPTEECEEGIGPWATNFNCIDDMCVETEAGVPGDFVSYQDCINNGCVDNQCDEFNEADISQQYSWCRNAAQDMYENGYVNTWNSPFEIIGLSIPDANAGQWPICCPSYPGCHDPAATNFTADTDPWYFWDYIMNSFWSDNGVGYDDTAAGWDYSLSLLEPGDYNPDLPYNGWNLEIIWNSIECEYEEGAEGCLDPLAINYSEEAYINDDSCEYVTGCTDTTALNYNEEATQDDGSCEYICDEINLMSEQEQIDLCTAYYNGLISTNPNDIAFSQQFEEDNLVQCCPTAGCTDPTASNFDETAIVNNPVICEYEGCTDPNADNYDPQATIDDGSCGGTCYDFNYQLDNQDWFCATFFDPPASIANNESVMAAVAQWTENGQCCPEMQCQQLFDLSPEDQASLCESWYNQTDADGSPLTPEAIEILADVTNNGLCCPEEPKYTCIYSEEGSAGVCTQSSEGEYDTLEECQNEGCEEQIYGCIDETAINYDSTATVECEACCQYVEGCTDPGADNYNPEAIIDDGSCEYTDIPGCTDPVAVNYDEEATIDDGSCLYAPSNACEEFDDSDETVQLEYCALWDSPGVEDLAGYEQIALFTNSGQCCPLSCDDIDIIFDQYDFTNITTSEITTTSDFCEACDNFDSDWWDSNNLTDAIEWCECCDLIFPKFYTCITPPPYCTEDECFVPFCQEDPFGVFPNLPACEKNCPGDWEWPIYGCTDPEASNYDENAEIDDDSCIYDIEGCTDPNANNYDEEATIDDGSCIYDDMRFKCNFGWGAAEGQAFGCSEDPDGEFDSMEECEKMCVSKKYKCIEGWGAAEGQGFCEEDPEGEFDSIYECEEACPAPKEQDCYKCDKWGNPVGYMFPDPPGCPKGWTEEIPNCDDCDDLDLEEFVISIGYLQGVPKFCRDCDEIPGFIDEYWQCECCPRDDDDDDDDDDHVKQVPCYKCQGNNPVGYMFQNPPGCPKGWTEEVPDCGGHIGPTTDGDVTWDGHSWNPR